MTYRIGVIGLGQRILATDAADLPLLELADGTRLSEGPAIVQYIADQVPDKQLAPANGTLARYRLQEWLTFIGTELHKTFSPLFVPGTPDATKASAIERLQSRLKWARWVMKIDCFKFNSASRKRRGGYSGIYG